MLSALGDPILSKVYRVTSFVELFVSAAIHGDEIKGVEIFRRVMKLNALKNLRGEPRCRPHRERAGVHQPQSLASAVESHRRNIRDGRFRLGERGSEYPKSG